MESTDKGMFIIPATLQNDRVTIRKLTPGDFEALYQAASDPLIWEQHPNPTRYQRPVFEMFFKGAMASDAAFLATETRTGKVIGTSRYYDYGAENRTVCIGYTFLTRDCWGKSYNRALKTLMLDYAFRIVDSVFFHVGHRNMRSRKAMEKLGGVYTGEMEMSYYGEAPHTNIVYRISAADWIKNHGSDR